MDAIQLCPARRTSSLGVGLRRASTWHAQPTKCSSKEQHSLRVKCIWKVCALTKVKFFMWLAPGRRLIHAPHPLRHCGAAPAASSPPSSPSSADPTAMAVRVVSSCALPIECPQRWSPPAPRWVATQSRGPSAWRTTTGQRAPRWAAAAAAMAMCREARAPDRSGAGKPLPP